jgi:hypothetical protein
MFVRRQLHPDPQELVAEYARRDGIGEFLSSETNHWDLGARTCPGHEAGFDAAVVITDYRVDRTSDRAHFRVTYGRLGLLSDDSTGGLEYKPEPEQVVFLVVKTPFGWRIDSLDLYPHILVSTTLRLMQLSAHDRALLDSVAAGNRRLPPNQRLQRRAAQGGGSLGG